MALFSTLTVPTVLIPLRVRVLLLAALLPLSVHTLASADNATLTSENLPAALKTAAQPAAPTVLTQAQQAQFKTPLKTLPRATKIHAKKPAFSKLSRATLPHASVRHSRTALNRAASNSRALSRTALNHRTVRAKNRQAIKRKVAGRTLALRKVALAKPLASPATTIENIVYAPPSSSVTRLSSERDNPPLINPPPQVLAALRSNVAYVQDLETSTVLFSKNEDTVRPIASISKLMTALVIIDANQPLDQMLQISDEDVDRRRYTSSRLPVGTRLSRADMLHLALMSSENRAAHALGRHYPGGVSAFAQAMNEKAQELGMIDTHFVEPTGLSNENVSSPRDLVRLLRAAGQRPLIHRYTTDSAYGVKVGGRRGRTRLFRNTNALVNNAEWDIKVSKTGFIHEAGECLVMLARLEGREVAIVILDSHSKYSRIGDAVRLRNLVQNVVAML